MTGARPKRAFMSEYDYTPLVFITAPPVDPIPSCWVAMLGSGQRVRFMLLQGSA